MKITIVNMKERPDLAHEFSAIGLQVWPEFVYHEPVVDEFLPRFFTDFPEFQLLALDNDEVALGYARAIGINWDGQINSLPKGWSDAIVSAFANIDRNGSVSALCAVSAGVAPLHQGKGVGRALIAAMSSAARGAALHFFVAPVRPTSKALYPLTPMERYVQWTRPDGSPFDPWIRSHHQAGGTLLHVCPQSMTIRGTTEDWEAWTGMYFPESGPYIVPGALVPIQIDIASNVGAYIEPNVWFQHPL